MDYTKDWYWLNDFSKAFLDKGYVPEGQDHKQHFLGFAKFIADILEKPEIEERIVHHLKKGHFLLPTPAITNYITDNQSLISCYGSYVEDSVFGLMFTDAEVGMMSKIGGGTSAYLGDIRPKGSPITGGGFADGVMRYIKRLQDTTMYINQKSRRGKIAVYLNFDHGEIDEFLTIKDKTSDIQEVPFAVCISDKDIENIKNGDRRAREIWAKVIKKRFETGFPYIYFSDNVNNNKPEVYKHKNLTIKNSNLCTEILLANNNSESFICAILGLNLFHFDEFSEPENKDVIEIAVYIIDAMLTHFINLNKDNPLMARAVKFAENQRAIGLGASGWHSYLQRNMIPMESMEAKMRNVKIFKYIQEEALKASQKMAKEYGKPALLKEDKYDYRHVTRLAVAPNTSSSEIFGQWSQSIEPNYANAVIKALAKTKRLHKNPLLENLLESKGVNTEEIWDSIINKNGSVQHLSELTDHEKMVFKTMGEISPMELVIQQSQRQKYIDQGVSFNILAPYGTKAKEMSQLLLKAHELGVKTVYYQLNQNAAQTLTRKSILECESCAG